MEEDPLRYVGDAGEGRVRVVGRRLSLRRTRGRPAAAGFAVHGQAPLK